MAKQLVLNTDAAHSYLHNFINETFPKPSREPQVYDIANKFFYMIRNARNALEQVLLSADWDSLQSDTTAATLEVGVDLLVISSAHTKVSDEHIKDLLIMSFLMGAAFTYKENCLYIFIIFNKVIINKFKS